MGNYNFDFNFIKSGAPIVTISSLGISFNSLSRSMLKYPKKINVGFDENARAIGVKAHNESSSVVSYEFEGRERNGWIRIGCKDFVKYLYTITNIDFISKAIQFIAEYDEDEEMLIIIVDEEHIKR